MSAEQTQRKEAGDYDPRDPQVLENPYPHYHRLQARCPVVHSPQIGKYLVSRYDDIRAVCGKPELFSNEGTVDTGFGEMKVLVTADEPLHGRQRRLINMAFTPRRVQELRPFIEQRADELIDSFIDDGACDLVTRFALMIPAAVISKMMGVSVNDLDKFKRWAEDGIRAAADPEKYLEQAMVSALELAEYITDAVELRRPEIARGEPRDDLLTALVMAEIDGDKLTNEEIFFICWQLLTAGHETTTALICSCVKLLTEHPDQRAKLLADPGLLDATIEEVLRYESPAQAMPRRVTQDTELAGTTIPAGSLLTVMFGAANRDADKWPEPDRFDITRPLNDLRRHMAFGYGVHACLGSNLARIEARIALAKLLQRMPDIAVAGEGERELSHFTRAWTRLPVSWTSPCAIESRAARTRQGPSEESRR